MLFMHFCIIVVFTFRYQMLSDVLARTDIDSEQLISSTIRHEFRIAYFCIVIVSLKYSEIITTIDTKQGQVLVNKSFDNYALNRDFRRKFSSHRIKFGNLIVM